MLRVRKLSLYVDRSSQQWIVQDEENLWIVPPGEDGWEQRQPFHPTEETALEPIPAHYKYALGLPP